MRGRSKSKPACRERNDNTTVGASDFPTKSQENRSTRRERYGASQADENARPPTLQASESSGSASAALGKPSAPEQALRPPIRALARDVHVPRTPVRQERSPARTTRPSAAAAPPPTVAPASGRYRRRGAAACSHMISALLLLALCAVSVLCAALLYALLTGATPADIAQHALLLAVEPPCEPPMEEFAPSFLGLPAPTECRWSWATFRCRPSRDCHLRMRWSPLPRPTCRMRPEWS